MNPDTISVDLDEGMMFQENTTNVRNPKILRSAVKQVKIRQLE